MDQTILLKKGGLLMNPAQCCLLYRLMISDSSSRFDQFLKLAGLRLRLFWLQTISGNHFP